MVGDKLKNESKAKTILIILTVSLLFGGCAASIHNNKNMDKTIASETNTGGLENSPEGARTDDSEKDIRQTAYDQLATKDKERIAGSWEDSKVSEIILKESMGSIHDKSYIGKKVYLVDFPVKSEPSTNNMIVYLGMDNNKIIGYGYVD